MEALSESELLALLFRHGRDGLLLSNASTNCSAPAAVSSVSCGATSISPGHKRSTKQTVSILCAVELSKRLAAAATPTELLEDPAIAARHLSCTMPGPSCEKQSE